MADAVEAPLQALQQMRDALPEKEKKGNLGRMVNYIMEIAMGGWSIRQALKNLGELQAVGQHLDTAKSMLEKVEGPAQNVEQIVLDVGDYLKKNCSEAMKAHCYTAGDQFCDSSLNDIYEAAAQGKITEHGNVDKIKESMLDGMNNYHRGESDRLVQNMVWGSAFVALVQLLRICGAWKKISEASNVTENPYLFTAIKENLAEMEKKVTELLDLCKRNPKDSSIGGKVVRIDLLYTQTLGKISNLRVNINGHIQTLDLLADYSAVDGVVNLATAGTQGYQLWHAWPNLSSYAARLGVASVAVFMVLAFGNLRTYYLSQKELKELRKNLNEVNYLQEMLQDLQEQAAQAFKRTQPE